jgi:hypothetical protein
MRNLKYIATSLLVLTSIAAFSQKKQTAIKSGNPIFPGWYADPEAHIYNDTYWVYPTYSDDYKDVPSGRTPLSDYQKKIQSNTISAGYKRQTFLDAFSSKDLVHWTKHPHVLDIKDVKWAAYAIWAPTVTEKDGKYYLFFGANDIQMTNSPAEWALLLRIIPVALL